MKKILYIALLLIPSISFAQVSKQVEVIKDYKPTVSEAQKLSIVPDMTDTVTMRPDIDYTITPSSYQTALMTQNFKPATITYWDYNRARPLYVRAAAGVPLQSEADIYLSTVNKDRGYAMIYANHWGDYRARYNLADQKIKKSTTEMSNRVGGRAGLFVGPRTFEVDILGDMQERHRYPSTGELLDFGRGDVKLRFGDDFKDLNHWNFNVEAAGGLFIDDDRYKQQYMNQYDLSAKVALGKMMGRNVLRIHAGYEGVFGTQGLDLYKNNSFMAGARYGISGSRFDFLVGADYYYDNNASDATSNPHKIFPFLHMTWKNATESFVPFIEVDGGIKRNDYASLVYTNPFLADDGYMLSQMANEYQYNGRAGFGGTLGKGLFSYNISAELSLANNHAYWYTDARANYYYTQAYQHTLRIDGSVMLHPVSWFEAELRAGIYAWENYEDYYSNRSNFDASLGLRYLGRKISASITAEYRSGIKWMTLLPSDNFGVLETDSVSAKKFGYEKTNATFTLDAEVEYRINDRWVVYAEGRNLLGSKIYDWLNYYRNTPEGIVGVKMSF